jgi:surface antigen
MACAMGITGCTTTQGQNEQAGMVIGGVLGGLLGAQVDDDKDALRTGAIIVGTMAGAYIGGNVGRSMDDVDRMKTNQSLETVRTGVGSTWTNPDSGNRYTVVPTRTYESASGPCREYSIDAVIEGRLEKVNGTACRDSGGTWRTQY